MERPVRCHYDYDYLLEDLECVLGNGENYADSMDIYCKELEKKLDKYKWHDLRKDHDDLPNKNSLYLVILLPPNKDYLFREYSLVFYSDLMKICDKKHWHNGLVGTDDFENYDERVVAWKYIEEFEDE